MNNDDKDPFIVKVANFLIGVVTTGLTIAMIFINFLL